MAMSNRAVRYIFYSQLAVLATSAVCLYLDSSQLFSNNGFSFYGNFRATVVPFAMGLLGCAYFAYKTSKAIKSHTWQGDLLRSAYRLTAVSLVGIVLAPSFANKLTAVMHLFFGSIMYTTQAVVAWKLLGDFWQSRFDRALLILQLCSVAVIVLSFSKIRVLDLMIPAQIAELIGFGVLCMRVIARMQMLPVAVKR
jgi:hypothetical protein